MVNLIWIWDVFKNSGSWWFKTENKNKLKKNCKIEFLVVLGHWG